MHNIDRTNMESNYGEYAGEYTGEYGAGEYTGEYGAGEYTGEYAAGEYGYEAEGEFETYGEYSQESPFSEAEEMELAAELLTVQNEAQLDMFLGKIFKKVGGFFKSGPGRALGGALKGLTKKALPVLGGVAGNFLLPGVGGAIGSSLASAAGSVLGLELEGLSYEDQEFEVAKQIVRLGGEAASNLAQTTQTAPPVQAAQAALTAAAQKFAPGLVSGAASAQGPRDHPGGRHEHRALDSKCQLHRPDWGMKTVTYTRTRSLPDAPTVAPGLRLVEQEARALLVRLGRVTPFALQQTMVPAAALPPALLSSNR